MWKYEEIENGIANRNISALREAIGNLCFTSKDFSSGEFDEAINYVKNKGIDIMDYELIGDLVSKGKDTYSKDDFADAVFMLQENFCKERIADVKKIGRAVYGQKKPASPPSHPKYQPTPVPRHTPEGTHPNSPSHRKTSCSQSQSNLNWLPVAIGAIAVIGIIILIINLLK